MAQRVGRDLGGLDTGGKREFLDQKIEPVARQVSAAATAGKEVDRHGLAFGMCCFLGLVALHQPFRKRLPRRIRQRHQPFLTAFAHDQQQSRVAPCGADLEADKLAHPHTRSVKQFHQTGVAQLVRYVPARIMRRVEQQVDFVFGQYFRQAFILTRSRNLYRGVIRAPAFLEGKAVQLFDGR